MASCLDRGDDYVSFGLPMNADDTPFFDCRFIFTVDDLVGKDPYVLFEDDSADPFMGELLTACRGPPEAIYRSPPPLRDLDAQIYMTGPVWHRNYKQLREAGVCGNRAGVVLYFDIDPSGTWDFAKACRSSLFRVFHTRELDEQALKDLSPYLEEWLAGRPFSGRLTSLTGFLAREFKPLIQQNAASIMRVLANFADDVSRATYARILFASSEEIFGAFVRKAFGEQQYMEIVQFTPGDHIINCGVNRGWELPYFICKLKGKGHIYNFDPAINYNSNPFGEFIDSFSGMIENHYLILGTHDGCLSLKMRDADMAESSPMGSEYSPDNVSFPMRSIDSLTSDGTISRVDYIKMDVEGGEKSILEGALETIRIHRPKLAVAIYHEPEHFWEYPAFLMDRLPDYNFYLRQYGYSRFETLLYATPKEDISSRPVSDAFGVATKPDGRCADHSVSFFVFDRLPRTYYQGTCRVLIRFEGRSWAHGDIKGGPRIEAEAMVGVWEGAHSIFYATRHLSEDGQTRITLGCGLEDPIRVEWRYVFGCANSAVIIPVDNVQGALGFAVYEPSSQMGIGLWGGRDTDVIEWKVGVGDLGTPVLVSAIDGGAAYEVYTLQQEPLSLSYHQIDQAGVQALGEVSYKLPKPIRGVVRLKRYIDGQLHYEPAFAVGDEDADWVDLLVVRPSGLTLAGSIDLDHRTSIVPLVQLDI